MMNAIEVLARLANLKDTEVQIERGGYGNKNKWSVRIAWNDYSDDTLNRVSMEAKHENFEHAVLEAWEKFEKVALKGLGQAVLQPALEYKPNPDDYRE